MKISSPAFNDQTLIPSRYTCDGPNVNPPLVFEDVPDGTKSLVLLVEDVDAPANPWVHWLVFNIPATTLNVPEGMIPPGGREGLSNNHTYGYEGPCPRYFVGTHRYHFNLYALDNELALPSTSDRIAVLTAMIGHVLAEAQLVGLAVGDGSAI